MEVEPPPKDDDELVSPETLAELKLRFDELQQGRGAGERYDRLVNIWQQAEDMGHILPDDDPGI